MKPRTVMVTLQVETDERLQRLRDVRHWDGMAAEYFDCLVVKQVQVNVAQPPKPKKAKRARR